MFDVLKKEYESSKKLIREVIENKCGKRTWYQFEDGSTIQLRTLGDSGHPKIEIFDKLRNIKEK